MPKKQQFKGFERGLRMFGLAQCQWWREPDLSELGDGCAAARMWQVACNTLLAPHYERAWLRIVDASQADTLWHSLRNCTAYQANVWTNLQHKGFPPVTHPAGFKLAIVLRHCPTELTVKLLGDLLSTHPQSQDLIDYILALLTDDEPVYCGACDAGTPPSLRVPQPDDPKPAPLRDLKLFGDIELAILAADNDEYDAHAKLVRNEYSKLTQENYVELRIKILNELTQVSRIFHTPEFEEFEPVARDNIQREITMLREHLLTGRKE